MGDPEKVKKTLETAKKYILLTYLKTIPLPKLSGIQKSLAEIIRDVSIGKTDLKVFS